MIKALKAAMLVGTIVAMHGIAVACERHFLPTVRFAPNEFVLTDDAKENLAGYLEPYLPEKSNGECRYVLQMDADSVGAEKVTDLSRRRAASIQQAAIELGWPADRIKAVPTAVYGPRAPMSAYGGERGTGHARIAIRLLSEGKSECQGDISCRFCYVVLPSGKKCPATN